jgi:ATP-dependent RNA helicase DeaD
VGAIANEAGIDSKFIGRIEIFDTYSTVDLPEGMPKEVLQHLKKVWVAGQELRISLQRPGVTERTENSSYPAKSARPKRDDFKSGDFKPGDFRGGGARSGEARGSDSRGPGFKSGGFRKSFSDDKRPARSAPSGDRSSPHQRATRPAGSGAKKIFSKGPPRGRK